MIKLIDHVEKETDVNRNVIYTNRDELMYFSAFHSIKFLCYPLRSMLHMGNELFVNAHNSFRKPCF